MGNLDFSNEPMFSWYCLMLVVSGFMLIGASFVPKLTVALKAAALLGGLACLGYAYYLIYAFHGGTYFISIKLFLLPLFLIAAAIRALIEQRDAKKAPSQQQILQRQQWAARAAAYAQQNPQGQPQPGQGWPGQPAPGQSVQAQAAQAQAEWAQSPWAVPSAEKPASPPPTPAP